MHQCLMCSAASLLFQAVYQAVLHCLYNLQPTANTGEILKMSRTLSCSLVIAKLLARDRFCSSLHQITHQILFISAIQYKQLADKKSQ